MQDIFTKLRRDETWWPAEIALRGFGLSVLALCAAASQWLYRSVQKPPDHSPATIEIIVAAVAFLSWGIGWAFLAEGSGLFRLIHVPGRHPSLVL